MLNQTDATLQDVLSQMSSMETIRLLPWCVSVVVPPHYIGQAATMATQQDEGISTISGPCPLCLSMSLKAHQFQVHLRFQPLNQQCPLHQCLPCQTSPWQVLPCYDILLLAYSFLQRESGTTPPMTHLIIFTPRGLPLPTEKLRSGVSTTPHGVMTICPI